MLYAIWLKALYWLQYQFTAIFHRATVQIKEWITVQERSKNTIKSWYKSIVWFKAFIRALIYYVHLFLKSYYWHSESICYKVVESIVGGEKKNNQL